MAPVQSKPEICPECENPYTTEVCLDCFKMCPGDECILYIKKYYDFCIECDEKQKHCYLCEYISSIFLKEPPCLIANIVITLNTEKFHIIGNEGKVYEGTKEEWEIKITEFFESLKTYLQDKDCKCFNVSFQDTKYSKLLEHSF